MVAASEIVDENHNQLENQATGGGGGEGIEQASWKKRQSLDKLDA